MPKMSDPKIDSIYSPKDVSDWLLLFGKTRTDIGSNQLTKKLILEVNSSYLCLYHNRKEPVPRIATDSRIAVVFEGELHNREELGGLTNEAEIIVQLYKQLGERAIEKLKGIYCLVIWDSSSETLLCVRDRLGIYPFFYCQSKNNLFISSSLESLVNHSGISKTVDRLQIAEHLLDKWIEPERTYFKDVKRLPAGNILRFRDGQIARNRYWHSIGEPFRWASKDEIAEFSNLLKQSVSRMLGKRKPGIFLSGGIDSVTVAAITTQLLGEQEAKPLALSLHFPSHDMDESFLQSGVAKKLGFKQLMIPFEESVSPNNALEAFLSMSKSWPMPIVGFWLPSFYYLALKGREQGCEVILTGGGGDEWLGVGSFLVADLIKSFNFRALNNFWKSINNSYTTSKLSNLNRIIWTFGFRLLIAQQFRKSLLSASPHLYRKFIRQRIKDVIPDWFGPDKGLRDELIEKIIENRVENTQLASQIESNYLYESYINSFENPVISLDQECMYEFYRRVGIKILAPFLDSDLVDLLYHTHPEVLNQNSYSKGLVRDMLANNFPGLGFESQKKTTTTDFYRSSLLKLMPTMLKEIDKLKVLYDLEILDKKKLGLYIERGEKNLQYIFRLREIINLETWLNYIRS
jgi:asparagine synthase (glutamine-hydrolysing)